MFLHQLRRDGKNLGSQAQQNFYEVAFSREGLVEIFGPVGRNGAKKAAA